MYARVVELVDTQDLKSCGHYGRAGSSPAPGTTSRRQFSVKYLRRCTKITYLYIIHAKAIVVKNENMA